mgnify:CR=1 FL=1
MKKFLSQNLLLFMGASLLISSCTNDCECPEPSPSISQYTLDKTIVEINTTNVSTGLESIFNDKITDSTNRAHLCQTFVDYGRFYSDESGYFFIETLDDAWVVAHINHDLIGTSRIEIKDEYGNYFIKAMVETVRYAGHGFVEYYRKNPATELIERKMSFVTSIPSAQWFIGTGFYGDPPSNYYDYDEAHRLYLMEATKTMAKGIGGVLKEIYTIEENKIDFCQTFIDHIRFFDNRSGYFFIVDLDGICIAQGANPELEGENISDLQDTQGTYFIKDMIDIVKEHDSGSLSYFWNNPATGEDEIKNSYFIKIPDTNYFIGAGYYLN